MRDFKKIRAWQLADDMAVAIYDITQRRFPKQEHFGLASQIRRAAVSVASNIAEGSKRRTKRDYLRFLDMANGSLAELEYQLHLSSRLKYVGEDEYQMLAAQLEKLARTLYGLIKSVEDDCNAPMSCG